MTGPLPRVGVYGLLGSGNIGNDGSFDVVLEYLGRSHPDAIVDVISDSPEGVAARWGLPAIRLHWNRHEYETAAGVSAVLRKAVGKVVDIGRIGAWVRRHDCVVVAGMGVFETSLPLRPWGTPYSQFLVCAFGRLLGTRVALVGVGATVAGDRATRMLFVGAARRAHYLSYRDAYSRDAMRRMGLRERGDQVGPDLVHALASPPASDRRTGVVGVGVLDYYGNNDHRHCADQVHALYVARVTTLVCLILDDGRAVRFLTGDSVDERTVAEIVEEVGRRRPDAGSGLLHHDPIGSLAKLMEHMAGVDAVVATRYHNVICALKLAKPTISIGYAFKNDVVMADMGLAEFCHRADGFDPELVYRQLGELDSRRDELVPAIRTRDAQYRRALDEQFDALSAVLFRGPIERRQATT